MGFFLQLLPDILTHLPPEFTLTDTYSRQHMKACMLFELTGEFQFPPPTLICQRNLCFLPQFKTGGWGSRAGCQQAVCPAQGHGGPRPPPGTLQTWEAPRSLQRLCLKCTGESVSRITVCEPWVMADNYRLPRHADIS